MLTAPPQFRVRVPGQASELFLARGASFQVPREAVPFSRGQGVAQQAGECLIGGAGRHEMAPRVLGRDGGGSRSRDHDPTSSFWISSWSIFCTLLLAT